MTNAGSHATRLLRLALAIALISTAAAAGPAQGSDECATPTALTGQGSFAFDNSSATTGTQGQTESLCLYAGVTAVANDVWFEWTAPCSGPATMKTCTLGTTVDTKIAVYPGSGCPLDGTALACNEDACGSNLFQSEITWSATIGSTYTIQLGTFPGANGGAGTFNILVAPCDGQTTPLCFGDGSGTGCPCGNGGQSGQGCANGTGQGARLDASGTNSVSTDDLVLESTHLLAGQPGLFFQGENEIQGGNGVVFGDGLRCCGMNVVRLEVVAADGSGTAQTSVGVATKGGVSAGDQRCYQYWYRDPNTSPCGAAFNLSNAQRVVWGA